MFSYTIRTDSGKIVVIASDDKGVARQSVLATVEHFIVNVRDNVTEITETENDVHVNVTFDVLVGLLFS